MRAAHAAPPADERARLASPRTVNGLDEGKSDMRAEDRAAYDKPMVHPTRTHPVHGTRAGP